MIKSIKKWNPNLFLKITIKMSMMKSHDMIKLQLNPQFIKISEKTSTM